MPYIGPRRKTDVEILSVLRSTDRRGSEVFGVDLAAALTASGRSVRTVALVERGATAVLDVPVLGTSRYGIGTLRALRDEARSASVVIAHGSATLAACAIASAGLRVPFVYRSIGDPAYWSSSTSRRIRTGTMLRRAAAVVALWPAAAEELRRLSRRPDGRVDVIPNAVPSERFPLVTQAARATARQCFGVPPGSAVAIYVGALERLKHVATAILAVASVPDAHLLVVGEGPDRLQLDRLAGETAPGRVHFLGSVTDPSTALAAADVIVLPSETEGMPAALIEAAMSGVPAVAADVGGVSTIVLDGRTGVLVPPADVPALAQGVRTLLADGAGMGLAARAYCLRHFDLPVVLPEWATLIDRVSRP